MGKYSKYMKHYRCEWEKESIFKGWLCQAPKDLLLAGHGEAYCKLCLVSLQAQKHDLKKHLTTKTHKEKALVLDLTKQKSLMNSGISIKSKESKRIDMKLALHVAAHSFIRNIDHLSEMLQLIGKGTKLESLRMHRTKCSKIILHVVAPGMLKELIADIGSENFSIILDESTDISTMKYMGYCIRYFSKKLNSIVTNFLGFSEVATATANDLYNNFTTFIAEVGLNLKHLIAIGTDGASNLCGVNHSLYTLLKEKIPNLQLIRCSCHSLNLCSAKACTELPSNLEFLLRETRNWFTNSTLRQLKYSEMYAQVNNGNQPPKLIQLSSTRWLAWSDAVSVNVRQWKELKEFFQMVAKSSTDKCYVARTLAEMYEDDSNLLYFLFLDGILKEIANMNLAFQKTNADITKLYSDLRVLLLATAKRIFKPSFLRPLEFSNASSIMLHHADIEAVKKALEKAGSDFGNSLLPLDSMDFGTKFQSFAAKKTISRNSLNIVMERIVLFIIRLCEEFIQRLPLNLAVIDKLCYFSPEKCLSQFSTISIKNLPWDLAATTVDKNAIEEQWRKLGTLRLHDISPDFDENVDISKFWIAVRNIRNASGDRSFGDLALFAIRALSLPISNADVERVFSIMSIVKTKTRNRMLLPMLVAIMRIRIHMHVFNVCCTKYEITEHMFALFNSNIYENSHNLTEELNNNDLYLTEAMDLITENS